MSPAIPRSRASILAVSPGRPPVSSRVMCTWTSTRLATPLGGGESAGLAMRLERDLRAVTRDHARASAGAA